MTITAHLRQLLFKPVALNGRHNSEIRMTDKFNHPRVFEPVNNLTRFVFLPALRKFGSGFQTVLNVGQQKFKMMFQGKLHL